MIFPVVFTQPPGLNISFEGSIFSRDAVIELINGCRHDGGVVKEGAEQELLKQIAAQVREYFEESIKNDGSKETPPLYLQSITDILSKLSVRLSPHGVEFRTTKQCNLRQETDIASDQVARFQSVSFGDGQDIAGNVLPVNEELLRNSDKLFLVGIDKAFPPVSVGDENQKACDAVVATVLRDLLGVDPLSYESPANRSKSYRLGHSIVYPIPKNKFSTDNRLHCPSKLRPEYAELNNSNLGIIDRLAICIIRKGSIENGGIERGDILKQCMQDKDASAFLKSLSNSSNYKGYCSPRAKTLDAEAEPHNNNITNTSSTLSDQSGDGKLVAEMIGKNAAIEAMALFARIFPDILVSAENNKLKEAISSTIENTVRFAAIYGLYGIKQSENYVLSSITAPALKGVDTIKKYTTGSALSENVDEFLQQNIPETRDWLARQPAWIKAGLAQIIFISAYHFISQGMESREDDLEKRQEGLSLEAKIGVAFISGIVSGVFRAAEKFFVDY